MSSTQTTSSRGKKVATTATKAVWDAQSKECFIQACVEELGGAGYKEGTQLTKVGWANVVKKFNERRGKDYDRSQLKNQWGVLKKEWQLWQHLVLGESGLGRDPDTGAITASEEWWDLKLMRHPDCIKFREKPLPLEEEMRILFGSNTATGEHMHTPSSGSIPAAPKQRTINLEVDDIDALLDNDDEVQELVHPLEDVSKKRRADGSATKKGKGKKGTMGSRLEACMQQICDSNDSASSPSSVHRAAPDIPTIKECGDKLLLLPEFDTDPTLWAKAHNLFRDARTRTLFMTCPDEIRRYHFITQELQRVETAELQKMGGNNWFNNRSSALEFGGEVCV
ncbi:hypothetical protein RHSIM_Rhsim05G0157800 [Rhododendron simsii]|uniref:Myb/SANT-like domain-containing protein n=1 Tax=Rhododendron simsii TaxID=118357 RepID=A0A834LL33_RHOSS|nr:hypothetical protein RHSIM_Rhsim05G0157800 [Rhododendron simsii]